MTTARTEPKTAPARDAVGIVSSGGFGPYHWTRWWKCQAIERPRVNHKPNSFAKLATVRKHVSDFVRAYQVYGDRGEVIVTIRDHLGRIVERQSVWPNAEVSDGGPLTPEPTETRTRRSLH